MFAVLGSTAARGVPQVLVSWPESGYVERRSRTGHLRHVVEVQVDTEGDRLLAEGWRSTCLFAPVSGLP